MEKEGLSNIYIASVLNRCKLKHYRGIFSCNNIPTKICRLQKFSIICNLDREGERGSHFIAIVGHPEEIEYIDPLGLPCFNKDLANFMRKCLQTVKKRVIKTNTVPFQHPLSSFCGFYTMLTVLFYDDNAPKKIAIKFSKDDLWKNDTLCIDYICQLINYYLSKTNK